MNDTKACLVLESYDVLNQEPSKEVLELTRGFRDNWLTSSPYSHLIEEYYNHSKAVEGYLSVEMATEILNVRIPQIIELIKKDDYETVVPCLENLLNHVSGYISALESVA